MKKMVVRFLVAILIISTTVVAGAKYPASPITLVCPWGPGGSTDITARAIASVAEKMLGVPVIVENREGGGSSIGTQEVANIRNGDGHRLLVATINGISVLPHTLELNYSPANFKGVGQVCEKDLAIIASSFHGWKDINDFIKDAKKNPGAYMLAVPQGSLQHISFQMLCEAANIDVIVYPISGDADAITAVLGGTADLCMPGSWNTAQGQLESGDMTVLAALSGKRITEQPEVKTLSEFGYDITVSAWTALLAPASVSDERMVELQTAFKKVLTSESLAELLVKNRQTPSYLNGEMLMDMATKQFGNFGVVIDNMYK